MPTPPQAALATLAGLVVKSGVHLGGLSEAQRAWALGGVSEAQANARLKSALAAEAAFLDTDHVELRRWLVDTGWWRRDGFGRCYERVPADALPPGLRPQAEALAGIDLPAWVAALRQAHRAERERRRQSWGQG
jgi:hypothetical protein